MKALMRIWGSVLIMVFLTGCATTGSSASGENNATALELRQIDASVIGRESLNIIRIETYGPDSRKLYAYFLYRDGLTVQVTGPMTGKTLGKMSLKEVQADYQRVIKENMIDGGNLVVREAVRGKAVCGYTANMPLMNYTVWATTDALGGTTALRLTLP